MAEIRLSEKSYDHVYVWAPEVNLKCLATIELGREMFFQQNSNILLKSVFPHVLTFSVNSIFLLSFINIYIISLHCLYLSRVCFL